MKKTYETPDLCEIDFDLTEELLVSVIDPPGGGSGGGTEIGGEIPLW